MALILKIAFNSQTNAQVIMENPAYIPGLGDFVDIKTEDYFTNSMDIEVMKQYLEKGAWKVGFKTISYSKKETIVLIVLEEIR